MSKIVKVCNKFIVSNGNPIISKDASVVPGHLGYLGSKSNRFGCSLVGAFYVHVCHCIPNIAQLNSESRVCRFLWIPLDSFEAAVIAAAADDLMPSAN